jgi:hypothetical protein
LSDYDTFYSEENMDELERPIAKLNAGIATLKAHEVTKT